MRGFRSEVEATTDARAFSPTSSSPQMSVASADSSPASAGAAATTPAMQLSSAGALPVRATIPPMQPPVTSTIPLQLHSSQDPKLEDLRMPSAPTQAQGPGSESGLELTSRPQASSDGAVSTV